MPSCFFLPRPNKKSNVKFRLDFLFCILVDGGNAINKIIFLKARAMKKDAATLVASGPQGTLCNNSHLPLCLVGLATTALSNGRIYSYPKDENVLSPRFCRAFVL